MWVSNYYFSTYVQNSILTFFQTGETYFILIFCSCLVLLVDGIVVSIDFDRGGYASRMRQIIEDEQEQNKRSYL